jgi:hypothetical protein
VLSAQNFGSTFPVPQKMARAAAEPQFTATEPRLRGAKRHPVFYVGRWILSISALGLSWI